MSSLSVSAYIRNGLEANKMTYRELSARSGVPISTLSAYARGQVERPVADNLARIVEAFGGSEDDLQSLYAGDEGQEAERGQVLADQIAEQTRGDFADALKAYAEHSEAQYKERLAAVQAQYQEYLSDAEQLYAERLEAEQMHHDQLEERNRASREYLKRLARNRAIVIALLAGVLAAFMAYSFYAFTTFDLNAPDRGLYRVVIQGEESQN